MIRRTLAYNLNNILREKYIVYLKRKGDDILKRFQFIGVLTNEQKILICKQNRRSNPQKMIRKIQESIYVMQYPVDQLQL